MDKKIRAHKKQKMIDIYIVCLFYKIELRSSFNIFAILAQFKTHKFYSFLVKNPLLLGLHISHFHQTISRKLEFQYQVIWLFFHGLQILSILNYISLKFFVEHFP
jgi:hypothetical protein